MAPANKIVCFGELLLRLNAPKRERLLQSRTFDVYFCGAEANVAVSLAQFGHEVRMASIVPDSDLGEAAIGELRRYNVDVSFVGKSPGRMGLYYMSAGAVRRPSEILYDRRGSAFAEHIENAHNWQEVLAGAKFLHLSGVTPAVGHRAAQASLAACRIAANHGVPISFDGNYRSKLWAAWQGDGQGIFREIVKLSSVAFINERDIEFLLDRSFGPYGEPETKQAAFAAAFEAYPNLKFIAATSRMQNSIDDHTLSAVLASPEREWHSKLYDLSGVVDRIGAGDAFAAGVLHGFFEGLAPHEVIEFGAAAAAVKHSIPGDFNIATVDDVEHTIADGGFDVQR